MEQEDGGVKYAYYFHNNLTKVEYSNNEMLEVQMPLCNTRNSQ